MGEIGIPRREFLYELRFWEVRRIIRGYRRRDRLKLQMLAECVYASIHTMRDPKGKTVEDLFPALFEYDEQMPSGPALTQDEVSELQADIDMWNNRK